MIISHTRSLSFLIGGPLLVISVCGVMTACSPTEAKSAADPSVQVEDAADASVVTVLHPEQFPLAPVSEREVRAELQSPGVVAPDVSRTVPVMSLAGGRVVGLRARLGDTVKKGQVLLTIQSPD